MVYISMDRPEGKELAKQCGVMGTPTFLLLDSEDNQVNTLCGSLPSTLIERAIEDLIAQQAVTVEGGD